jgi:hypothetical protein
MFGIEWLRGESTVERETSVLKNLQDVISSAENRATEVARRHPGNEPNGFRINDASGKELTYRAIDKASRA